MTPIAHSADPAAAIAVNPEGTTEPVPFAEEEITLARETGEQVVIEELTTELSQTRANPDGTFTYSTSTEPVRIQRDGSWIPIDTTLVVQPDGSIAPSAAALDVAFSPGGDTPYATLSEGAQSVALSWPEVLPAPVLSANTATYPEVMPGVDLQVAAGASSFHQSLIVKTAQAAANPDLAGIDIDIHVQGLTLDTVTDGVVDLVDPATGGKVFESKPPVMWDSASNPDAGPDPTATNPGGAVTTALVTQVTVSPDQASATVTLEPAPADLVGIDVQYPVYIDPTFTESSPSDYGFVFTNGWNSYNNASNDLKVGWCNWPGCNGIGTGRSFVGFNIEPLANHPSPTPIQVASASVRIVQTHQAQHCGPLDVVLFSASGAFTPSTTWNSHLANTALSVRASSAGSCAGQPAAEWLDFNDSSVASHIQNTVRAGNPRATFGLVSAAESNALFWKRFAATGGWAPVMDFVYGYAPSGAAASGPANPMPCASTSIVTSSAVTLKGIVSGNNPSGGALTGAIDVKQNGITVATVDKTVYSHQEFSHTFNLVDGVYSYTVRAATPGMGSTWSTNSAPWTFTVKTTQPTTTPTINSFEYPKPLSSTSGWFWGAPKNRPGMFSIGTGGASGIAGYAYSWNNPNVPIVSEANCANYHQNSSGGIIGASTMTLLQPPTTLGPGPHTLYVRSFNDIRRMSPTTAQYSFLISPDFGISNAWKFEAEARLPETELAGVHTPGFGATIGVWDTQNPTFASGSKTRSLNANGGHPTNGPEFYFAFYAPATADYAIGASLLKSTNLGEVSFQIKPDNKPARPIMDGDTGYPVTVDTYRAGGLTNEFHPLGGMRLEQGWHRLIVRIVGKNAASSGYSAAVDYFYMIPISRVTSSSFTAAFNNDGISALSPAGNIGPSNSNSSLPVSQFNGPHNYAGVTFPMPSNYAGKDNIIAMGQTVPLPAGANNMGKNLRVLVGATCGDVIGSSQIQMTVNYQDPAGGQNPIQDVELPTIPDFINPVPNLTQAPYRKPSGLHGVDGNGNAVPLDITLEVGKTMNTRYVNGQTSTTPAVNIYVLTVPLEHHTKPITSITLPNTGVDLVNQNGCTRPALHVFSATVTGTSEDYFPGLAGNYVPIDQARIVDTRDNTGGYNTPQPSNLQWREYQVRGQGKINGQGGVPDSAEVRAVAVTVTTVLPTFNANTPTTGTLQFGPGGPAKPQDQTSTLTYESGDVVTSTAIVPVGDNGKIALRSSHSTNVLIDVTGYFTLTEDPTAANAALGYSSVPAFRFADTRNGQGGKTGKFTGGTPHTYTVGGQGGVPVEAKAVYANITIVDQSAASWFQVYPTGSSASTNSRNFKAAGVHTIGTVINLNNAGQFDLKLATGTAHAIVDVVGYFGDTTFNSLVPLIANVYDNTTHTTGLAPNSVTSIQIAGAAGLPTDLGSIAGVVLNLQAYANPSTGAGGWLKVWPAGQPEPTTAINATTSISFGADKTESSTVIVEPGIDGKINVKNMGANVNLSIDAQGYFHILG